MTLTKEQLNKLHTQYLEAYPKYNTLYFTADGNCFLTIDAAKHHAGVVKTEWYAVSRTNNGEQVENNADEAEQNNWNTKLLSFELNEKSNWDTIQELGRAFGIDAKSKREYIDALAPIKEQLMNK